MYINRNIITAHAAVAGLSSGVPRGEHRSRASIMVVVGHNMT